MAAPPFSAIIPHRNRPAVLCRSLHRVQQYWSTSIREVLVVDDASDAGQLPQLDSSDLSVRLLRQEQRHGAAACRNAAAAVAVSPLLLFLDDDSWPEAGMLPPVAEAFVRDEKLAAVGFRVLLGTQCESGGAFNAVVGCGAAVRREAFLQAGGFPVSFGFYAEEYALCYQLLELAYRVRMWAQPTVFHGKVAQQRDNATILAQLTRNNRRLLEPHLPAVPVIANRLQEILEWYRLLGRRFACESAVEAACQEDLALPGRKPWCAELWQELSGQMLLDQFAERLRDRGIRAVSLWPVGKDTRSFSTALSAASIDVLEVLDPESRYGVMSFAGLPVTGEPSSHSQATVIASFSPGLCWNGLHGPLLAGYQPVYAGFAYLTGHEDPVLPVRQLFRKEGVVSVLDD